MTRKIARPSVITSAGNKPKEIQEYIGRVNTETSEVSVAKMTSPPGWKEPGQTPEFNEYTLVLKGTLRVKTGEGTIDVHQGEAVIAHAGDWVQYSTPFPGGAEYIAVCCPGFSPDLVHRDRP